MIWKILNKVNILYKICYILKDTQLDFYELIILTLIVLMSKYYMNVIYCSYLHCSFLSRD